MTDDSTQHDESDHPFENRYPSREILYATPLYTYLASVDHVVDGDTLDCTIALGFDNYIVERVRLRHIDTREISFVNHDSEEYERGMRHYEYAKAWVDESRNGRDWPFILFSEEFDLGTYGRVLGDLYSFEHDRWLSSALYETFDDVELYD